MKTGSLSSRRCGSKAIDGNGGDDIRRLICGQLAEEIASDLSDNVQTRSPRMPDAARDLNKGTRALFTNYCFGRLGSSAPRSLEMVDRSCTRYTCSRRYQQTSGLEMPAKPAREISLADTATSDILHSPDCVHRVEVKPLAVVCQEQTRSDPCRPLVAVEEAVVVGEAIGIRRGQVGRIRGTIQAARFKGRARADSIILRSRIPSGPPCSAS